MRKKYPQSHKNVLINKWPVFINDPFINCDRIYPTQQKKVKKILRCVPENENNVNKVIVFGSSTTAKYHSGSDVDVYFELDVDKHINGLPLDVVYDLWTNYTADERLRKEIIQTGVTVYERNIAG